MIELHVDYNGFYAEDNEDMKLLNFSEKEIKNTLWYVSLSIARNLFDLGIEWRQDTLGFIMSEDKK